MTTPAHASPAASTVHAGLRTAVRLAFIAAITLTLLTALAFGLWWMAGAPHDAFTVIVNDEGITLPGAEGGEWLLAVGGVLLALLIVLVVVPLALLVGLGVPAVLAVGGLAIGLLCVAGIVALAFSPLVVPVLLVWWLVRRSKRAAAAHSTSMPA